MLYLMYYKFNNSFIVMDDMFDYTTEFSTYVEAYEFIMNEEKRREKLS